jgi:type VI secretion system protein ImpC
VISRCDGKQQFGPPAREIALVVCPGGVQYGGMPQRISFDHLILSSHARPVAGSATPSDETPFRILLLGDFSGRASRGVVEPLERRRAMKIDVDNLDEVLARLKPEVAVPAADGSALPIAFGALDDFHPDRIFDRLPLFQKMRETRDSLRNPATASRTALEVASWAGTTPAPATPAKPVESGADTFARLLGVEASQLPSRPAPSPGNIQSLIQQIVAPHIVAAPDPTVLTMTAALDAAISAQMRAVLRAPAFRAIEAAWRGLDFLVRNLETDETLKLSVLDVSKAEFAADLCRTDDLAESALFKIIVEETVQTPGGEPWALVAAAYHFSSGEDDAGQLARMAKLASGAGAPFVAGAAAGFVEKAVAGEKTESDAWSAVRGLREAKWLGLIAPDFLLRLPYGRETEACERFEFEEIAGEPQRGDYVWGNAAFACACLLGESFRDEGWSMTPGGHAEVSGLPAHTYRSDGERKMTPCGEVLLTDRQADALGDAGVMPLIAIRDRDAVRVARFQSVAPGAAPLAGRWAQRG